MRRITAFVLAALMLLGLLPEVWSVGVQAAENGGISLEKTQVNPVYTDIISADELKEPGRPVLKAEGDEPVYATTVEDAGAVMREGLKKRQEEVLVYLQTEYVSDEQLVDLMTEISDAAMVHTGVPTEGDYLLWQYAGWKAKAGGEVRNGVAYVTYTYTVTYYTTAQQEEVVDEAVEDLLAQLDVAEAADETKVRAVYDYICANVVYDYEHVNNSDYKTQYTAYGALIDGTSVCQGYAVLLYRLALELDVDCRLVAGKGNGEAHGWNIVELNDVYYNLDSTWDAGETEYSYFLVCDHEFHNHVRYDEYAAESFYEEYPMPYEGWKVTREPTCEENGIRSNACMVCGVAETETIDALGHSYDSGVVTEEPTCTAPGVITYTCANCGGTYTKEISAAGHSYDGGVVTEEPTCTAPGVITYTCANCGGTYTEEISADGHSYDGGVVTEEPTCTAPGVITYTCANCGDTVTDELDVLEHTWNSVVTKPTCTEEGYTTHTCDACGETYTDSYTDRMAHNMVNGSCTECGAEETYRISGASRYETSRLIADALKQELGVARFEAIVVANGANFADALAGSYLANRKNAPILLASGSNSDSLKEYIRANLEEGGSVYLLGGTKSVPAAMETGLEGFEVIRVAGKTRYETNLEILKAAGTEDQEILICTGTGFADSLSASGVKLPILLVGSSLTEAQREFLESAGGKFTIIGGEKSVSAAIAEELSAYGTVERVSGSTRYETSVLVARRYFEKADAVVLAGAMNFPDGLCGGPLAGALNVPLILTATGNETKAADYVAEHGISRGIVLGGASMVSDESIEIIFK